jgi:hypothetical protein
MAFKISSIEREKRPEPFEVELSDGSLVTFTDPKRLHFTVLTGLDEMSPNKQIETLTGSGWDKFSTDPEMDGEALEAVMTAYREHYGLGSQGEAGSSSGS